MASGNAPVAADTAEGIRTELPPGLDVEILADPQDLLLFDDLLGIADPEVPLPQIDPDARRRRLTALINTATLARTRPALLVIEDAHWIDADVESCAGRGSFLVSSARRRIRWPICANAVARVPNVASATDRGPQNRLTRTCLEGASLCIALTMYLKSTASFSS